MTNNPRHDLDKVWDDRGLKAYGEFTDKPLRTGIKWGVLATVAIVVTCLAVVAIVGLIATGSAFWNAGKAKVTAPARVTQATYGTDNILHNIGYFHDQCNTILADNQNVANAEHQLAADRTTLQGTTDPIAQQQAGQTVTQDVSTLTGTRDQLSNDVRDYDSKSATQTANPFKAHNLPYRIDLNEKGLVKGSISCH